MTPVALKAQNSPEEPVNDAEEHARAWAMVSGVLDNVQERLTLLHAAAMLKASLAIQQPDPIRAATLMLEEHAQATLDLTATALDLRDAKN